MDVSGSNPLPAAATQQAVAETRSEPRATQQSATLSSSSENSATSSVSSSTQAPDPNARVGGRVDTFA